MDAFDDAPLREFIKDKEILSLRDYFFNRHDVPYLAVVVSYNLPPAASVTAQEPTKTGRREETWRELLTPEDVPIFQALRDWRNERSRREGMPPYLICTNRQLAEMAHQRVANKTQLTAINGFGKAKCESYGADILAILREYIPDDGITQVSTRSGSDGVAAPDLEAS